MPDRRQKLGQRGEDLAVKHLGKMGYKILERNFRTRSGEIDIVAKHQNRIVFIEVKTRGSNRYGHPKLAVTAQKQRKISMVALEYLKKHATPNTPARFDVVSVQSRDETVSVEVISNAFDLAYG